MQKVKNARIQKQKQKCNAKIEYLQKQSMQKKYAKNGKKHKKSKNRQKCKQRDKKRKLSCLRDTWPSVMFKVSHRSVLISQR